MGFSVRPINAPSETVTSASIQDATILTQDIANLQITTNKLADLAVTAAKLASDTITAAQIAADAVGSSELADNAVDTAALQNLAVTAGKIATDSLTASQLAADSVGSSEIGASAVGASEIGTDAVDTDEIKADAVGASEIATGAVGTAEIADGSILAADFAPGAVGTASVTDQSLTISKDAAAQALTASGSISASGGKVATFVGSAGQTIKLPAALSGMQCYVLNIDSADSFTLQRADTPGTDTIEGLSSFSVPAGARYLLTCTADGTWKATTLVVPLVTALPATPFEGMVVDFSTTSMLAASVIWRLRYTGAASTAYKWLPVGCDAPYGTFVGTSSSRASSSYGNLADANTNQITVPAAGYYRLRFAAKIAIAGSGIRAQVRLNGVAPGGATPIFDERAPDALNKDSWQERTLSGQLLATGTLYLEYSSDTGANIGWANRSLEIAPVALG